jgi:hypothetical protein
MIRQKRGRLDTGNGGRWNRSRSLAPARKRARGPGLLRRETVTVTQDPQLRRRPIPQLTDPECDRLTSDL